MLKADSRVIPAVKLDRSRTVLVDTHSLSLACRALERNTVPSSVGDYESRALASIIQTVVLYDTVAHAPSAVELISSLPIHWKDVALHQVIRFLFQKLPPGEPYENPEKHYNVAIEHELHCLITKQHGIELFQLGLALGFLLAEEMAEQ